MPHQGIHVMASSWPATAYMLQRKEVPPLLRAPVVHDIARRLGKRAPQARTAVMRLTE